MYVPPAFSETDTHRLHDFIEAHSFGLLVSTIHGELFASHIPFLIDRSAGENGQLLGHLARANPQWQELHEQKILVVFSGPHAYISPTWYESENVVPTWNYLAVHAAGLCRVDADTEMTKQILTRTVATYERSMPKPWSIDASSEFFEKLARQVASFRIDIKLLEGKWKLGQNHPRERRAKVVQALESSNVPDSQAIARLMAKTLE